MNLYDKRWKESEKSFQAFSAWFEFKCEVKQKKTSFKMVNMYFLPWNQSWWAHHDSINLMKHLNYMSKSNACCFIFLLISLLGFECNGKCLTLHDIMCMCFIPSMTALAACKRSEGVFVLMRTAKRRHRLRTFNILYFTGFKVEKLYNE